MPSPNSNVPAYVLTGIGKMFDGSSVFNDVNLRIEQGEMIALTGQSGSGKSTLLNILGLLQSPDRGRIRILGQSAPKPRSGKATQYLRYSIGYLFQNYALIDDATVKYNLGLALAYRPKESSGRSNGKQLMIQSLQSVGLNAGYLDRPIHTLSGGEQQRVAIARLQLKPCSIVLADEPTGSLDERNRDGVLNLLYQLNAAGRTIIIATHDPVVVAQCGRVIALEQYKDQ